MIKKRGLGKPLNALLTYTGQGEDQVVLDDNPLKEKLTHLPIDLVQRGKYQPRREIDQGALETLAHSIRNQGVIQPLIVRPVMDRYEIIAGERRWHAAKLAGLSEIPAIIRPIPDEVAVVIALIENIQRENLNPIEEAIALDRLIKEFGMTHQQAAEAVGKSRASVTNLLRLLALPEDVKGMLERGMLEMGHARTLITLAQSSQLEVAQMIIARELSVRDTENLVRRLQDPPTKSMQKREHPDILRREEQLSQHLKLRVAIHCNAKGKGRLVIHYRNLGELDGLLAQFEEG